MKQRRSKPNAQEEFDNRNGGIAQRSCLRCDRMFRSDHFGHRRCDRCEGQLRWIKERKAEAWAVEEAMAKRGMNAHVAALGTYS